MPSTYPQTLPLGGAESLLKQWIADLLAETRARTLSLVAGVSVADLERVHSRLMSPLVWDLGHIAAFEDLWLCAHAGGLVPLRPDLMEVYDATETPRARRGELAYLRWPEALDYMDAVRARALAVLEETTVSIDAGGISGVRWVWPMVIQHEQQHNETMLQCLQLAEPGVFSPERAELPAAPAERPPGMAHVGAGPFAMGDDGTGFAYDNERPRHVLELPAFEIDRTPVTNGDYLEFVADGGYARHELWTDEGWAWRASAAAERPLYWTADGRERRFERIATLDRDTPVMHVSWFEADAYARWAGKRLPTEEEWEKAAAWGPGAQHARRHPWGDEPPTPGHTNLDQLKFGPAPAGAYPAGASRYGVLGMTGDAWEWTASDFAPYPGFSAFPYDEYSAVFFGGGYKVLRGCSWATRWMLARNTNRNWDYPGRRQIFAGFRCARDAG